MKKRVIITLLVLATLVAMLGLAGCNVTVFSGTSVNSKEITKATSWHITASSLNGHGTRTVNMSPDGLSALNVTSMNAAGNITLTLSQGDTTSTVDISGNYSGSIDTSKFAAGKLNLRLDYANAKDVDVYLSW